MKKTKFSRICKFHYKGNYYQMFKAQRNRVAFLKIDENGAYIFPTQKEFEELVLLFESHHDGNISFFRNGKHTKVAFVPSVLKNFNGRVKMIAITSAMVASILSGCGRDVYVPSEDPNAEQYLEPVYLYDGEDIDLDVEVEDTTENVEIQEEEPKNEDLFAEHDTTGFVTTDDYELLNSGSPKSLKLYNNNYFEDFFGCENYKLSDIEATLEANKNIPDKYRPYIKDFIEKMYAYYPDLEWRPFVYNLSTLEINVKSGDDIDFMSSGALAYYNSDDNIMCINKDYDIDSNELGMVTFRHELGHMLNNFRLENKDYKVRYYFKVGGEGQYLQEALDVILTSEPFLDEYSEATKENMGYSLTTNEARVLIDCLDYDISDSVSNNVYDFERRMGEYMPDDIEPSTIETILEVQWLDLVSSQMEVDVEDYADFYRYLAKMYIKKHCTADMSYDEIIEQQNALEATLLTGIHLHPEYVYTDDIEDEFNNYMELNNISSLSR